MYVTNIVRPMIAANTANVSQRHSDPTAPCANAGMAINGSDRAPAAI